MDWPQILGNLGGLLLILAGFFVSISFMGGFAGAVAAGGREDRSLLYNFGIGLAGATIGSGIWAAVTGEWPEELNAGAIVVSFVVSIGVAVVVNRYERRRAERPGEGSGTSGVSV